LTAGFVKGVEGVEKLLLGRFLPALQKMDVVDEKEISFAIAPPEFCRTSIDDGADQLIHELLCPDVCNSGVRAALKRLVRYSLHEMSFA